MNKKVVTIILAGAMVVSSFSFAFAQPKKAHMKKGLVLKKGQCVLDEKQGDVNGDKIKDTVYLVGEKVDKDSMYVTNIDVKVVDGKTNKVVPAKLDDAGGYGGELFLGDFTGDKIDDIMVELPTGGSGGIVDYRILNMKDNKPQVIFGEKENQGIDFEGKFIDDFKVKLNSKILNKEIILDVSAFKDEYIESGIYDKDGKLLSEFEPWIDAFSELKPVIMDEGLYGLIGRQAMSGNCHANTISNVDSMWKYEDGKWVVKGVEYTTFVDVPQNK
jgi:hypothetical protein